MKAIISDAVTRIRAVLLLLARTVWWRTALEEEVANPGRVVIQRSKDPTLVIPVPHLLHRTLELAQAHRESCSTAERVVLELRGWQEQGRLLAFTQALQPLTEACSRDRGLRVKQAPYYASWSKESSERQTMTWVPAASLANDILANVGGHLICVVHGTVIGAASTTGAASTLSKVMNMLCFGLQADHWQESVNLEVRGSVGCTSGVQHETEIRAGCVSSLDVLPRCCRYRARLWRTL